MIDLKTVRKSKLFLKSQIEPIKEDIINIVGKKYDKRNRNRQNIF